MQQQEASSSEESVSLRQGNIAPYITFSYQLALNEARNWKIIALLLLVLSICLGISIMSIMPLKQVEVRYVEFFSGRDNYFKLYPAKIDMQQKQALIAKALRNYVQYANVSDNISAKQRFAEVKAMSSNDVFLQMQNWYKLLLSKLGNTGTRDINITYSQFVTDSIFEVEFETIDLIGASETKRTWVAKLEFNIEDQNIINTESATYNPLGIKIIKYHISERIK